MDFLDTLREKAFLGREFLTWLWFKADATGGIIPTAKSKVLVVFLDRMKLDLTELDSQVVTIRGEQSEMREAVAALREGKWVESARLSVQAGDLDYILTLNASWFTFSGLRTPPVAPSDDEDTDEEGAFLEKVFLVETALEVIDNLFHEFLLLRTSDAWGSELSAMRTWITEAA